MKNLSAPQDEKSATKEQTSGVTESSTTLSLSQSAGPSIVQNPSRAVITSEVPKQTVMIEDTSPEQAKKRKRMEKRDHTAK